MPFLKSVNMSLFNWLFEILGAKDKFDHLNSWLSFSFKYLAQLEFVSVPFSGSFHHNQMLCTVSPV